MEQGGIEHEQRQNGAEPTGLLQSRMVIQAQIAAEPENRQAHRSWSVMS
jgi:hypothetical protein